MTEVRIDGDRLWQSLEEMAQIGATPLGGSRRLALTDEDRAGRDLFVRWATEAGCGVTVDAMGNIFARRPGGNPDADPVMSGSHLDTQPTGGRFDGVLGVLAPLEAVRALNDAGIATARPIEVAVWTNEEGSRFQPAMMGSAVFAGLAGLEETYQAQDKDGLTVGGELARIGYKGDRPAAPRPIHAYFETHIEQGPVLETDGKQIGIVTGIQGMKWIKAAVRGINSHAGTTPMEVRRDPLLGAAKMVEAVDRAARTLRPDAVGTVGEFAVEPGSINVINREVKFSIDLRCPEEAALLELNDRVRAACNEIATAAGLELELEEIWHLAPTVFDAACVDAVQAASEKLGFSSRRIVSGAGHDAKYLADICPTAMIFVPCRDGISHNETEHIEPDQAAAGADVLLHAMLQMAG